MNVCVSLIGALRHPQTDRTSDGFVVRVLSSVRRKRRIRYVTGVEAGSSLLRVANYGATSDPGDGSGAKLGQ
ncbi:uncharacterized protein METZ01_LOCUS382935, partial [marine metagenome]